MPTAERDGHQIHFVLHGDPGLPPLLLVMGLGLSSSSWLDLPEKLARAFHVVTFDNRNTGNSSGPHGFFAMAALADDAAAVIEAAIPRGRAHVFGISMGGMIAQELAIRHPGSVDRLVLGATFASWRGARWPRLATTAGLLRGLRGGRAALELTRDICFTPRFMAEHPEAVEGWLRAIRHAPPRTRLSQIAAIASHHAVDRLTAIGTPTLILHGTDDVLVPIENGRALERMIPRATLIELEGAAHVFPLEAETQTIDAIVQFLRD